MKRERVVVAMSGGVDSSVVAAWFVHQGFEVVGLTFQLTSSSQSSLTKPWSGEKSFGGCCTINDVYDAKAVAHRLGIPHYIVNERERFADRVIKDFVEAYRLGRTPNPCVRCNQYLKLDILEQYANTLEAAWFATGHYARITATIGEPRRYELRRAWDAVKDQSYVLFPLTQSQLARLWLPLGGMLKAETREMARRLGLPTAEKPDSQDICFVPNDRYTEFLREQGVEFRPGPILTEEGEEVGRHEGLAAYTVGQRKGLGGGQAVPRYVKAIDPSRNAVIVAVREGVYAEGCVVDQVHWTAGSPEEISGPLMVKIRSQGQPAKAWLKVRSAEAVDITFEEPQWAVTPGQFAVWYEGDRVVGGGVIQSSVQQSAFRMG